MKKQVLCFMLVLAMMAGILPMSIITVSAEATLIYVGGIKLNDGDYLANKATTATTTKPEDNYAYYKDGVLTLHNYTHTTDGYEYADEYNAAIYCNGNLTIVVEGENSLSPINTKTFIGIKTEGDMSIEGTGSLKVETTCGGLYTGKECFLSIDGVDLTINSKAGGLKAEYKAISCGAYSILNSTTVINSKFDGVLSDSESTLREEENYIKNSSVTITAKETGLHIGRRNITIENSTVYIDCTTGIDASSSTNDPHDIIITDSDVDIKYKSGAIANVHGDLFVTNSKLNVDASGEGYAISIGEFTFESSTVAINSNGTAIASLGSKNTIKYSEVTINAAEGITNASATAHPSLNVEYSTLNIEASKTTAIYAKDIIVNSSKLTITAKFAGLSADDLVAIVCSEANINATENGIEAPTVSIVGSDVTALSINPEGYDTYSCAIDTENFDLGPAIVLASTEPNGDLTEFVEESYESYDHIVIKGEIEKGDLNADGYVDNIDAAITLKYDAGIINLATPIYSAADANGDGYADNLDASMILKYDAGIIDSL